MPQLDHAATKDLVTYLIVTAEVGPRIQLNVNGQDCRQILQNLTNDNLQNKTPQRFQYVTHQYRLL